MYVNRMRLMNLKPLHGMIPSDGGPLPEAAHRRLLLQGPNGSGKTTILETIVSLWDFWGHWLEEGTGALAPDSPIRQHLNLDSVEGKHYLARGDMAAIQILGLPISQPLWIGIARKSFEWNALQSQFSNEYFAGLVWNGDWKIQLPVDDLLEQRRRSLVGAVDFPNIVYFPAIGRFIKPRHTRERGEIIDTTQFKWSARYDPDISLDSILLTLKAITPANYEHCLQLVNLALGHQKKRIEGFGSNGRLVVEGTNKAGDRFRHSVDELSAGEQQMLLLVGYVAAFLRPGGIVLLDEPDIHIHVGMVAQLLQAIDRIVGERNGQMIVASHSQLAWNWFSLNAEKIQLSPWRGAHA